MIPSVAKLCNGLVLRCLDEITRHVSTLDLWQPRPKKGSRQGRHGEVNADVGFQIIEFHHFLQWVLLLFVLDVNPILAGHFAKIDMYIYIHKIHY